MSKADSGTFDVFGFVLSHKYCNKVLLYWFITIFSKYVSFISSQAFYQQVAFRHLEADIVKLFTKLSKNVYTENVAKSHSKTTKRDFSMFECQHAQSNGNAIISIVNL